MLAPFLCGVLREAGILLTSKNFWPNKVGWTLFPPPRKTELGFFAQSRLKTRLLKHRGIFKSWMTRPGTSACRPMSFGLKPRSAYCQPNHRQNPKVAIMKCFRQDQEVAVPELRQRLLLHSWTRLEPQESEVALQPVKAKATNLRKDCRQHPNLLIKWTQTRTNQKQWDQPYRHLTRTMPKLKGGRNMISKGLAIVSFAVLLDFLPSMRVKSRRCSRLKTKEPTGELKVWSVSANTSRFSPVFAPKPGTTAATHPQTFDDWMKVAAKKTTYASGIFLQSLAEKLGSVLIVWRKIDSGWQRYAIAARFDSNGFACRSSTGHSVVVIHEGEHFKLLKQPEGAQVPRTWLRETVSTLVDLSGGAGASGCAAAAEPVDCSDGVATPSVHSSCPTPSVHSFVSAAPSRRLRSKTSVQTPLSFAEDQLATPARDMLVSCVASLDGQTVSSSQPNRKRKAPNPVASDLTDQCEPYVRLPEQISVWWACSCGFQVLKHTDLQCHGPRRKKHLNQVHGTSFSDMPPDPAGAAEGAQTRTDERLKRCQQWLAIAKIHGWVGLHELEPVKLGWRRWKCQSCEDSFTHWNRGVQTLCPSSKAAGSSKVPNFDKRLKTCKPVVGPSCWALRERKGGEP